MMQFLINAFRFAAPASIGYFINDVATWVNGILPASISSKTQGKNGGFAVWFLVLIFLVLGGAVYLLLKMLSGKGKRGKIFGALIFALWCGSLYSGNGELIMATQLITLTTGAAVVSSANLQFVPERIYYAASTQLTGIKISVQGDGTFFDMTTDGLTHMGVNRILGQVTNGYVLTLANSLIKNKTVLFEFTNSAAQTPIIYYDSDSTAKGRTPEDKPLFLQAMKVPLLTGGNDYSDFATLALPSLAAADSITIAYKDGTVQANLTRVDLQYKIGYTQSIVNTPIYYIDNLDQSIKSVTVNCAAAQTGFMQRWSPSVRGSAMAGQV